jgi:hypothetical protein
MTTSQLVVHFAILQQISSHRSSPLLFFIHVYSSFRSATNSHYPSSQALLLTNPLQDFHIPSSSHTSYQIHPHYHNAFPNHSADSPPNRTPHPPLHGKTPRHPAPPRAPHSQRSRGAEGQSEWGCRSGTRRWRCGACERKSILLQTGAGGGVGSTRC